MNESGPNRVLAESALRILEPLAAASRGAALLALLPLIERWRAALSGGGAVPA